MNATNETEITVSTETRIIHNVCATFMSTFGFITNLFVTIAMVKAGLHHKVANVFVLNLIINNLIACCLFLPYISILSFTVENTTGDNINKVLCRVIGFFTYSIAGAEICGLMLISMNRLFLVVFFNKYQAIYSKRSNIIIMLAVSWTIYTLLFLIPATEIWGSFSYDPHRFFCQPFYDNNSFGKYLVGFVIVTSVPFLSVTYIAIIYKVLASRRKVNIQRSTTRETTVSNRASSKNERHLVLTVILILTTFCVLYTPFMFTSVLDPKMTKYRPEMHVSFVYLAWLHIIINPYIYSFMNPHIKKACLNILTCGKHQDNKSDENQTYNTQIQP